MANLQFITGASEVVERFGHWPYFHDAEVLSISIARTEPVDLDSVQLTISVSFREYGTVGQGTAEYHQELKGACVLGFAFRNAKEIELSEFNHQNVIDDIDISHISSTNRYRVEIQSIFGLSGTFSCSEVLIESIEIRDAQKMQDD